MSKKVFEPRKCWVNEGQKICYETREEALGAARLVETRHGLKPNSLAVYACEFCGLWHLANKG